MYCFATVLKSNNCKRNRIKKKLQNEKLNDMHFTANYNNIANKSFKSANIIQDLLRKKNLNTRFFIILHIHNTY